MNTWTWFDPTPEQSLALGAALSFGYWCWNTLVDRGVAVLFRRWGRL